MRGIDIISKRFSAFEKRALREILDFKKDDLIYELGAGRGNFSLILAFLNKKVISLDLSFEGNFWKLILVKKLFSLKNFQAKKADIAKMNYGDFENNISFIFAGRFLHYLKYDEAERLLKILKKKMQKGGHLYFSISALGTDLARDYNGENIKIEERFFKIKKELRGRFKIKESVCLYSLEEAEKLFSKYFKILSIEKTAFGNINIILEKE
jgi:cyclopropane fatty-acyl-phospholipid synthase-like methyltransferase